MGKDQFSAKVIIDGFQFISQMIEGYEKAILRRYKSSISQKDLSYIVLIGDHPKRTFSQLVQLSSVSKSTFSNQIKSLKARGYMNHVLSQKDKRIKLLALTSKGKSIIKIKEQVIKNFLENYSATLTDQDVEDLIAINNKIIQQIKKRRNI